MSGKQYVAVRKIDSGGMAEIHLGIFGRVDGFRKPCVIKKIKSEFTTDQSYFEMIKGEIKVYELLQHSNIVQLFDVDLNQDGVSLVMEYIEGDNLLRLLQMCSQVKLLLSVPMAVFIAREVAQGLTYAHDVTNPATGESICVVHRDISPANIIVSINGDVKLVDFGIAKIDSHMEMTNPGVLKGKLGYFAPEQISGQKASAQTDIYSLGVVLWESLAMRRLNHVENLSELEERINSTKPYPRISDFNSDVKPELEAIVDKMIAKDPDDRYQTTAEIVQDLSIFLNQNYPKFSKSRLSVFAKSLFSKKIKHNSKQLQKALAKKDLFKEKTQTNLQFRQTDFDETGTMWHVNENGEPTGEPITQKPAPITNEASKFVLHKGRTLEYQQAEKTLPRIHTNNSHAATPLNRPGARNFGRYSHIEVPLARRKTASSWLIVAIIVLAVIAAVIVLDSGMELAAKLKELSGQ